MRPIVLALVCLLAALAACAPYDVLKRSGPPSALQGATDLSVGFDYSILTLEKSDEAAFLRGKAPQEVKDWQDIKQGFEEAIVVDLPNWSGGVNVHAGAAPPGGLTMTVIPTLMRLGKVTRSKAETTELAVRCRWSRDAAVLDEIEVLVHVPPNLMQPSQYQRVRYGAGMLARHCGRYVQRAQ